MIMRSCRAIMAASGTATLKRPCSSTHGRGYFETGPLKVAVPEAMMAGAIL